MNIIPPSRNCVYPLTGVTLKPSSYKLLSSKSSQRCNDLNSHHHYDIQFFVYSMPQKRLQMADGDDDGNAKDYEFSEDVNEDDELDDDILLDMQDGAPNEWVIMKELLGINIFTYLLAALITIFLSLNIILGPGWLGQLMGLEGTGTFTQISDSLPDIVDLSGSDNLL